MEGDLVLAQSYLDEFVRRYEILYGRRHMSHNLHLLRHFPNVVRDTGPLWANSCCSFERLNGSIKDLANGTQHIGLQIQTNFELITRIPFLAWLKITPLVTGALQEFCLQMLSPFGRLKLSDCISQNRFVTGSFVRTNCEIDVNSIVLPYVCGILGQVLFFKRMKTEFAYFVVESDNPGNKPSCFVSYICDNIVYHGILQLFVKCPIAFVPKLARVLRSTQLLFDGLIVKKPFICCIPRQNCQVFFNTH